MSRIAPISLHLVRTGRPHNALLSPITPYIGLCGRFGVSTVNFPWEQADLVRHLARLRYNTEGTVGAEADRQHTLYSLGEGVGGVLSQLGGLASEMTWAESRAGALGLVHLRIRLWGSELAMVPFEVATIPSGMPGEGHRLLLKTQAPVCLTRELVGAHSTPVAWDRPVRVLFAFAAPGAEVPVEGTLDGIRAAVAQLCPWEPEPEDAAAAIGRILTILPFASLEDIADACAGAEYTHVYLLAHGLPAEEGGELRYAVALHERTGSPAVRRVTGAELGMALGPPCEGGCTRRMPSVVTLAICDGGNQGSVTVPGGSIAHALHERGVSWVLASQFPLHFAAASDIARVWTGELLAGTDPRWALQRTRAALARRYGTTHDWGALVAYASFPEDFDDQVERFLRRQLKLRTKALTKGAQLRADAHAAFPELEAIAARLEEIYEAAERRMEGMVTRPLDVPGWDDEIRRRTALALRAEFLGLWASARKQIGVAMLGAAATAAHRHAATARLEGALALYREAAGLTAGQHWQKVQALFLGVVLAKRVPLNDWKQALLDAEAARDGAGESDAMWARGSLAEIYLLASLQDEEVRRLFPEDLGGRITLALEDLRRRAGADPFPIASTRGQLGLYARFWNERVDADLLGIALAALRD